MSRRKEEKKKKKKEEKRREERDQSRHFWMETIVLLQSKINSTSQNIQVLQDQVASETNEINAIKDSINTLLLDQEREKQLNGKYFLMNLVTYIIINYLTNIYSVSLITEMTQLKQNIDELQLAESNEMKEYGRFIYISYS